jgi:hypothetical protein
MTVSLLPMGECGNLPCQTEVMFILLKLKAYVRKAWY